MSKINLYTASHTDPAHIREFYIKKLLREGETMIAVFDGIFYEAKNERVGGLAFHDYLIFSNKSVYIWARGIQKDYLDRFNLGAVSFKSKKNDEDFATLDITISRLDKEPINLIFDLVPIKEVEKITYLSYTLDSAIESSKGKNFLDNIDDELAADITKLAEKTLVMKEVDIMEMQMDPYPASFEEQANFMSQSQVSGQMGFGQGSPSDVIPPSAQNGGTYIYGETLLDQIRAMRRGETIQNQQDQFPEEFLREAPRVNQNRYGGMPPPPPIDNPFKNIDFISLKRAEAITKDLFNVIPEKYRERAKKDIEEMPKRMTEAVSVVSELLTNISQSPETQNFVIQAIATAVKNDGIVGGMMKAVNSAVQSVAGSPPEKPKPKGSSPVRSPISYNPNDANETKPQNSDQQTENATEQTGLSGNQRKKIKITKITID